VSGPDVPDLAMHEKALKDLGIRLTMASEVVDLIASGSAGAVATMAGAVAAEHIPRDLDDSTLWSVLQDFADSYAEAWNVKFKIDDFGVTMVFGDCAIRDICNQTGQELGGSLCALFHGFLVSYIARLVDEKKRGKFIIETLGESCEVRIDLM
jgi:hypothetical protein